MANIQILTILLVVTCLLSGVISVNDEELEVRDVFSSKQIFMHLTFHC